MEEAEQYLNVQPPSGGCVLKHMALHINNSIHIQPPSGGCVLKQSFNFGNVSVSFQPPSGGCVLKLKHQSAGLVDGASRLRAAVC